MFEDLIKKVLGDVESHVRDQVLGELKRFGDTISADQVAKSCSRAIMKGIDGVTAACVNSLGKGDAEKLMNAYTAELQRQISQFSEAIALYAPLDLQVELAKKTWGDKSKQANDARALREKGISEFRQELKDILDAAVGKKTSD
jgi:hypothetical protein